MNKCRQSNLELFRIIMMLVIIAHHYVVNSGLLDLIDKNEKFRIKDYFLLIFGWGGKIAINCFVLITGYFMCKTFITARKWFKLFLEVEFYNIIITGIFLLTKYDQISLKGLIKTLFPFWDISSSFVSCFLLFYLLIPFVNILLRSLTEKQHIILLCLCYGIYTIFPSMGVMNIAFNYITWFIIIYITAAYIRIYPKQWFGNSRLWGCLAIATVMVSWLSVIILGFISRRVVIPWAPKQIILSYFLVNDSNKILAVIPALCLFLFFKNVKIKYNRLINTLAASTFGVLMIHANSDVMRKWLWNDCVDVVGHYMSQYVLLYALISVFIIYIICTLIDYLRIRFVEDPIFKLWDYIKLHRKNNNL